MSKYLLEEVNGFTPDKIINEEKFIISTLKIENNACEGCKIIAIRYHEAIVEFFKYYKEALKEIRKDESK